MQQGAGVLYVDGLTGWSKGWSDVQRYVQCNVVCSSRRRGKPKQASGHPWEVSCGRGRVSSPHKGPSPIQQGAGVLYVEA